MSRQLISKLCGIGVTILLFPACEHQVQKDKPYPDKTFSTLRWINDSLGCSTYRECVHESVFKNENYFLGKSYKKILSLLGRPTNNYREGLELSTLYYVVECTRIPGYRGEINKYSNSEAQMLLFYMRRDTCVNMTIIIP
jgi:hypothetical protein